MSLITNGFAFTSDLVVSRCETGSFFLVSDILIKVTRKPISRLTLSEN